MGTAQASGVAHGRAPPGAGCRSRCTRPSEVKAAVSGSGRADKAQVGAMVTRILRLDAPPKPADAADALALAICHIWRGGAQARIDAALAARQAAAAGRSRDDRLRPRPGRRRHPRPAPSLEVGGVGLELMCTPGTLATLRTGQQAHAADQHGGPRGLADAVRLRSTTTRSRSSSCVQTASGVGPKLAQAMLAVLAPDDLRRAVAGDDVKTLTRVPGIGQKGAQRIILELKDRIGAPARRPRARPRRRAAPSAWRDQVHQGLVGLGWSAREADARRRRGGRPRPATHARRRRAAARRPPDAEQGLSRTVHEDDLDAAEDAHLRVADRRRGRRRRARRRGGAAAAHPRRGRSARTGSASSSAWCSRRPERAGARPTTCCSPARPGSARPRWR